MSNAEVLSQALERLNQNDFSGAEERCREVLLDDPENARAWHLCGVTYAQRGDLVEATECFEKATEYDGEKSIYHYNLGLAYKGLKKLDQAAMSYRKAISKKDDFLEARNNLGIVLLELGANEEAICCYRELLERFPDHAVARHMLASISGENTPERCHDEYVREIFDESFAKTFENQLTNMDYRAPQLVGDAFESIGSEMADLDVLDAGCGTGLCGPIFRSVARRLVGVDLSEDMLVEARKRQTYDETIAGEITQYMRSHPQSMNLIVSADTLCYFGELSEILAAAFGCLKDDGTLIFTVESGVTPSKDLKYELKPHGRYCHSESYVTRALEDAGFKISNITHDAIRTESGLPVNGLVVTASRLKRGQARMALS